MIRFLKGTFHPMMDGTALIETSGGIGFRVNLPANSTLYKNVEGEEVRIHTLMIVREDDMSLYGFANKEELDLFKLLISVNGVGPKAGISIMGILPPMELRMAIASGDTKAISAASGVGKKTAERIILELKDKVGDFENLEVSESAPVSFVAAGARAEAVSALISLGYSKSEAEGAVSRVLDDNLTVENYISRALKEFI